MFVCCTSIPLTLCTLQIGTQHALEPVESYYRFHADLLLQNIGIATDNLFYNFILGIRIE